jgi:multiple sugar transport system permease protein
VTPKWAGSAGAGRLESIMGYAFILPSFVLFILFTLIPALLAFALSFTNYDILSPVKFVRFDNYARLASDTIWATTLRNIAYYAIWYVPLMIGCSLLVALALNRKRPGMRFFRTIYYLPVITSPIAASTIWIWLLQKDNGLVNQALSLFRIPGRTWLYDPDVAMLAIVFVTLWQGIGGNMVIYLAGLQGIPQNLYEAAMIDGANRWNLFQFITWPSLRTSTFFVLTTTLIGAFQLFDQAYAMTRGGPGNVTRTPVFQIYEVGFNRLRMGYASSQAVMLFLIILFITIINLRVNRESTTELSS